MTKSSKVITSGYRRQRVVPKEVMNEFQFLELSFDVFVDDNFCGYASKGPVCFVILLRKVFGAKLISEKDIDKPVDML